MQATQSRPRQAVRPQAGVAEQASSAIAIQAPFPAPGFRRLATRSNPRPRAPFGPPDRGLPIRFRHRDAAPIGADPTPLAGLARRRRHPWVRTQPTQGTVQRTVLQPPLQHGAPGRDCRSRAGSLVDGLSALGASIRPEGRRLQTRNEAISLVESFYTPIPQHQDLVRYREY